MINLIKHQPSDLDKISLYVKDPLESKYQSLINKRKKVGTKYEKDPKGFIDYLQTIDGNLEDYNLTKERKVLIVFDNMIADMEANKSRIVAELLIRSRKLNISFVFISQSYFAVPETIRLNYYFIMKIPNKRELQQIVLNNLSDIEFKDFMKLYRDYSKEPFSFLVNDTTLPSVNPLISRKTLL